MKKKKKKNFMVQKLRATAHLSRQVELGAGWARAGVARGRGAGALGGMGAGALGGTGAGARGAGARGRAAGRAGGRRADGGARGSRRGRARSVRGRAGWAAGARPGRWARGLGAWAGLGLCTRCTRPIFDPF